MQTMYDRFTRRQFEESFHQNVVSLWQALYYQSLLRETNRFEWQNQDACQLSGLSKDAFFRARRQLITLGFLHVVSQSGSSLAVYTLLSEEHAVDEPKQEDAVLPERKAQLNRKRQEAQMLATARKVDRQAKGKPNQKMQMHTQVKPVDEPQAHPQFELKIADSRSKSLKNLKKNLVKSQRTATTNALRFDEISEYFDLLNPNEMMKTWLTEWFKRNGTAGVDLLIQALEETKEAERPSWRYTKTLLFNWEKSGFSSLEDVIASDDARLEKQFEAKKRPKQANKRRSVNHERATRSIREEYPSADF